MRSSDSLNQLCQSLYGRQAQLRDYSPLVKVGIIAEAACVIDQLDELLANREQFINLLGIAGTALVDGMRDLTAWVEKEAGPAMRETAELLDKAAVEMGRLEDQVDFNDRLMGAASDRIESDGRYIEELEADLSRLEYYKRILCWSPPSKMVMTPDGACSMPEIEKVYQVVDERDDLREEIKKVKKERDEAQATLDSINDFMNQKGVANVRDHED